MELELSDFLENLAEVFEKDVGFLAVQDVMVGHDGSGLHAELGFRKDKNSLTFLVIFIHSWTQLKRLLHQSHF